MPAAPPRLVSRAKERTLTLTVGMRSIPFRERILMNNIIWLIGAIVVVLAILSFLGLR